MRKRIDIVTVVLFLVALASFIASMKGLGHHAGHPERGFFSGG